MKAFEKGFNIVTSTLLAAVVILAILLAGVRLFGIHPYTVLSGSMEPAYHVGSLVYVVKADPEDLKVGDDITYMLNSSTVVTHRIVEILPDEDDPTVLRFRTKGIANNTEDGTPVHENNVIGKVFVSTGCKRDYTMRTLIYGTKGTIICDNTSDHLKLYTVDEDDVTKEPEIIPVDVNNHNAHGEMAAFVDAITNNKPILTNADEGARSAQACISIVESCVQGKTVYPDYNFA